MEATSTSRSLASAPLLSAPCPKPSVEAGAPSGLWEGRAFEGSPYPKGSTWLGLYECTVVQCVRRACLGLRFRSSLGSSPACSRQHKKPGAVSTLHPRNGEQGPRRPHGSLERCSFWVGNHIPPSAPPRRGYPSLPSTQEEREERARELLFEGGGTSLQSCSFLSPGEGMTVGMVVPNPQGEVRKSTWG